ncbi:related to salicylate 1-monooxygenase [Ramularia collo-cygni]|uniref:Related to salicylate 1-monooxygenase n=1 Tax=Ramularia collo-cygni TaxID=112498 RepID=A0A2D3UXS2_9PEZI|nr:related to salicylate 1-monooxygenase [Ramularia collo-cygni]CZT21661.1 related to salicylate 1-monooxygenase [Ramularia collo-cygni]
METPPKPPLKIAILGAGITGLALSIALSNTQKSPSLDLKIYESSPNFSPLGAGIGLGPNSLQAISLISPKFLTLYESLSTGNSTPGFENCVFDALYSESGFGEAKGWEGGRVGGEGFKRCSAHRRDLLNVMKNLIPEGGVVFGKRAVEMRQLGDKGVEVGFEDGERIIVDAVLGCDGIKGFSRGVVLQDEDEEEVRGKYCGMYIYRGILPMQDAKEILGRHAGDAKWFMGEGKGVAIYPISKGREENFVFFIKDDGEEWKGKQEAVACTKEEMRRDLQGMDERLVKLLHWASPLRWPIFHHPDTPRYWKGRVCLVGDVAHASSPGQAAGAGQGLEDAVVLAKLLELVGNPRELEMAFEVYDAVRRPRAQKVVRTSQEAGEMYVWRDPGIGGDMGGIVENANRRLHWIWWHDLEGDVDKAASMFKERVESSSSSLQEKGESLSPTQEKGESTSPLQEKGESSSPLQETGESASLLREKRESTSLPQVKV